MFRNYETPCEIGLWLRKLEISRFGDFAAILQLRNGVPVLRNGTRVPRGVFAEGGVRLRNLFLSGGPFSQPNLDFAEAM